MTCDEYAVLEEKPFVDQTSAERTSYANHRRTCQPCGEKSAARARIAAQNLTPKQKRKLVRLARVLHRRDSNDPEAGR